MDQWIELTAMLSVLAAGFLVWLYSAWIYFDFKPSNPASNSRKSKT